jgi:hypothetical protein
VIHLDINTIENDDIKIENFEIYNKNLTGFLFSKAILETLLERK